MALITNLVFNNGSTLDVSTRQLSLEDFYGMARAREAAATSVKTLSFNLYNAANAPFCLGSKAYASATQAQEHASTRKGNYFSSFEAKIDERRKTIELSNDPRQAAQYERYAVFHNGKFLPPSYESRNAAYRANELGSNAMIIKIGIRGQKVVSLSVV